MKKLFTLLFVIMAANAMAKDYTDKLMVTLTGNEPVEQSATISVEEVDGKYNFVLRNFVFGSGNESLPVGNIEITEVESITKDGVVYLNAARNVKIKPGDTDGYWWGPELPELPITVAAEIYDNDKMYAVIDIDMQVMQINVKFGTKQSFTDNLAITLNGNPSGTQEATILVREQDNGKYAFSLRNFVFGTMGIGNVNMTDVEGVETGGIITFTTNQSAEITKGDKEGVSTWLGPSLSPLPVTMTAKLNGDKLYANISLKVMGLNVNAVFGEDISAGIDRTEAAANGSSKKEVYDMSGKKVTHMREGNVYIIKQANGKTVKVVKK